jgi:hypothetical protein
MRNRAKCRLCGDILESFHEHDRVECSCGEIAISGGTVRYELAYRNLDNFLRLDDNDQETPVKSEIGVSSPEERRDHLLYSLKTYIEYEGNGDQTRPIQMYEFRTLLQIIYDILKVK